MVYITITNTITNSYCLHYGLRKGAGVTTSLKDSGLEVNVGSPSKAQVRLEIPHLHEMGQGPAWVYRTPEFPTMKAAQQDACKRTLAFLLAMNPEAVHLAPGSLKQGDASVENIRKAAREIRVLEHFGMRLGNKSHVPDRKARR